MSQDRERLIQLYGNVLLADTPYERGYFQGRFEEYAAQNAIGAEEFPELQSMAVAAVARGVELGRRLLGPEPFPGSVAPVVDIAEERQHREELRSGRDPRD